MDYLELALAMSRERLREITEPFVQDETLNESPANNDEEQDGA